MVEKNISGIIIKSLDKSYEYLPFGLYLLDILLHSELYLSL
jgi:hypothetical protein